MKTTKITLEELDTAFDIERRSPTSPCPRCKATEHRTNESQVRCGHCGAFVCRKPKT